MDITDSMGCITRDSVNVLSNPACIKVYDAFSPNDDDVNEFWKIDNIDLSSSYYLVYDRNGKQIGEETIKIHMQILFQVETKMVRF